MRQFAQRAATLFYLVVQSLCTIAVEDVEARTGHQEF
jgi:hypothetical protein